MLNGYELREDCVKVRHVRKYDRGVVKRLVLWI